MTREAIAAVSVLHDQVQPFFRQHNLPLQAVVTNQRTEFVGSVKHSYGQFLASSDIQHQDTPGSEANGFVARFSQIVKTEFVADLRRKREPVDLETLRSLFSNWLTYFNTERPHPGYRNMGKTPDDILEQYLATVRKESYEG